MSVANGTALDYKVTPDMSQVSKGDTIHIDGKVRNQISLEIGGRISFYGWKSSKFQV